ncbi:MAG: type II secretion system protein GspM [Pseudomonadales bacterium]|jgi:general secretion pathway protein M
MSSPFLKFTAPFAKGQQWFQQQSPSDRQRLRWLAGFLALVLLWVGVVNPVLSFRDRAAGALTQAQNDLTWLNSNYGALSAALAQRKQAAPQGDAALDAVAASAQAHGLTLNRFSPEGGGRLALSLDQAAYPALIAWLLELAEERGLQVLNLSIDRTDTPGMVRARIVLG